MKSPVKSPTGWWIAGLLTKQDHPDRAPYWNSYRLVQSDDWRTAFRKATRMGKDDARVGNEAFSARVEFIGITDFLPIYEEFEDAAEILWQELWPDETAPDGVPLRILFEHDLEGKYQGEERDLSPADSSRGTSRHQQLIDAARPLVRKDFILGRPDHDAASVAAAIRSSTGAIYTGVCIHLSCGLGFCAEHAAAAEMIKAGDTRIKSIVAVAEDGILAPCGRCREFLAQIDPHNAEALVILGDDHAVPLVDLLPHHWLGPAK